VGAAVPTIARVLNTRHGQPSEKPGERSRGNTPQLANCIGYSGSAKAGTSGAVQLPTADPSLGLGQVGGQAKPEGPGRGRLCGHLCSATHG